MQSYNNPYVIFCIMAAAVVLIYILWILYEKKRQKQAVLRQIRRRWGKAPEQEYATGDIEKISHYFRRREGQGFCIDDITWNDLDMDRMFMLLNQTMSSPGEDVLYDMLRRPMFHREEMEKREKLIRFFSDNDDKREQMQLYLSRVGKNGYGGSLSDVILSLEKAPKVSPLTHWILLAALLASLGMMIMSPVKGFFFFLILSVVNVVHYYTGEDRTRIAAFLDCFSSLLHMLSVADQMETVRWEETKDQMERIRKGKQAFKSLKKRAVFITSKNGGTGDPAQLLLDYVRMVFHIDILTYNGTLKLVQGKTDDIMMLLDALGELDAAIAIASLRKLLPLWCYPAFEEQSGEKHIVMEAEDLYHPLIQEPVANSIRAESGILVTGSNASGKSTFLKIVAINAILAQTVLTCTCSSYRAPVMKVMTSMALRDDLSGGESYFIVEIKSLKRILDESEKEEPLLCIIDEVLRGTNTIERIAASSQILARLDRPWVLPFAATHDIELSRILRKHYRNCHFEEEVREHQVIFNYLLKEGPATSRNAIRLLDMLEYDPALVQAAQNSAERFDRDGVWEEIHENSIL